MTTDTLTEQALPEQLAELVEQRVHEATADLREQIADLEREVEDLRTQLFQERDARREAEARLAALEETVEGEHDARLSALEAKANGTRSMIAELQSRELEKGAHLAYDNVEANIMDELLDVDGDRVERITKDDDNQYARLPGEEDALNRGGTVAHSTADLLPIQRLARYDDEMLASVTNRKPDELAAKAWRERDNPGRYQLWTTGSSGWRVYLKSSDLADWIMRHEEGVSKNYAQELARRTLDAMRELSNHRLITTQKKRTADGLTYKENVIVLTEDAELPGEPSLGGTDGPATDEVAG
ncbi:hypothetical protein [Halorussus sp. MSC15.2]|uniref:hypothetical protein n=1 Tax=Halorussus sp. MSC15.2 TaxID=2283638 RepID=UPI0013D6490A|nr:hypothetical protein [Halorussus sp. MSC15.2]NEU59198.1 hypothetical protein [Halorussus sp. MSC15.2]